MSLRQHRTRWCDYTAYQCRCCNDNCLNHTADACTTARECRECHSVPDLGSLKPVPNTP